MSSISGKTPSPLSKAQAWKPHHNEFTILYHGCLRQDATEILKRGVDVRVGRPNTDFGVGFYTTTLRRQGEDWAYLKYKGLSFRRKGKPAFQPVVMWLRMPREELAKLQTLSFVRGDYAADEYWALVQHCRASVSATKTNAAIVHHHERDPSSLNPWYDMVCGPVAAFWQQKNAMRDADQFSFHTDAAQAVLNKVLAGRRGNDYDVEDTPF